MMARVATLTACVSATELASRSARARLAETEAKEAEARQHQQVAEQFNPVITAAEQAAATTPTNHTDQNLAAIYQQIEQARLMPPEKLDA